MKIPVRFVETTTSTASHLTQQSFSTPEWTETISSWYIQSRVVNQFKLAISIDEETRRGWFESVINTERLFYPTERSDDEIGKGITRIQMTILTDEKGDSEGRKRIGGKCKRLDPTRTKIGSRQDTYTRTPLDKMLRSLSNKRFSYVEQSARAIVARHKSA